MIIVKKCFSPILVESFDSGDIPIDGDHYDAAADLPFGWEDDPPPPFDGCFFPSHELPYPAEGLIQNVCYELGTIGGLYVLPARLRVGMWYMKCEVEPTTDRPFGFRPPPNESTPVDKDVQLLFLHAGWPGIGEITPPLPANIEDGTPLFLEFEAEVPSLASDPAEDPCSCFVPGRLVLGWNVGINMRQAGIVRFTGHWLSDPPP